MKKSFTFIVFLYVLIGNLISAPIYVTSGNGGDWNDTDSWILLESGAQPAQAPDSAADVIIRHYLTQETATGYTHTGNITVEAGAVYEVLSGLGKTAAFNFAGKTLLIQGTMFTSGKLTLSDESRMVVAPASMCWIGGDLVMDNTGGILNQNQTCNAFSVLGGLRMANPAAFIVGEGRMIIENMLSTSWTGLEDTLATYAAISGRVQEGIAFFRGGSCTQGQAFLQGVDGQGGYAVEWDVFTAEGLREVQLEWDTKREPFTLDFTVERSFDGQSYEILGEVASVGDAQQGGTYSFLDLLPHMTDGPVYYRIRQNTLDGTFTYSPVRQLSAPQVEPLSLDIFPNPSVDGHVTLKAAGFDAQQMAQVQVRALTGELIASTEVIVEMNGSVEFTQQKDLRTGIYLLIVRQQDVQEVTRLVVY